MKKILFTLFLLSVCLYSEAQITFQKTYGGTDWEFCFSVKQTSDGGYIMAGETYGYGAGSSDAYLVKTDSTGAILWTKTYGGSDYDQALSVSQTFDGGYIIAGTSSSFGSGDDDIYLIRTDSNGNLLWEKTIGGNNYEGGACVIQTNDSSFIISGSLGINYNDIFIIKTNINGDTLWTKAYDIPAYLGDSHSIEQTSDGGYIIGGSELYSSGSPLSAIFMKIDAAGNVQWTKKVAGSNDSYVGRISQIAGGNYILTGSLKVAGDVDTWLAKLDSAGNLLWSKTYGDVGTDYGTDIKVTSDGDFIFTGMYQALASGYDLYIVKTDSSGSLLWAKVIAGAASENAVEVNQTHDGGYIFGGRTNSFGAGAWDAFLIKTDSSGNSNCNEINVSPTVVSLTTQLTSINPIIYSGATLTSSVSIVGSGGIDSTLCTTVGINQISNFQFPISISPNPSSGIFTITLPENFQKGTMEIYNVMGEKVYETAIKQRDPDTHRDDVYLDVSFLAKGIYFIKVQDGKKEYAEKVIVQ